MEETSVALAALGITGTVAAALIWLLKKLWNQNNEILEKVVQSNTSLAESINKLSTASEKQTSAIYKQEISAEKWQKYVIGRFDQLENIGNKILRQDVTEQTVAHQTVINKGE